MRAASMAAVVMILTGCGGNLADPPLPDLGFADVWEGVASVSPPFDPSPFFYGKTIAVSVTEYAVTVDGLCQATGPSFNAIGTDRTAQWEGAMVCFPAPIPGCDDATLTLRRMVLALKPGELEMTGTGVTNGCGVVSDVVVTFFGTPVNPRPQ